MSSICPAETRPWPRWVFQWGRIGVAAAVLWVGLLGPKAHAQRANRTPEQIQNVGVDQKLDTTIPKDLSFTNEQGESVRLSQYFDGSTPVMLTLNYHRCPQLCRIQLQKFAESLSGMSWTAGDQFEVLTVDINPQEGPEMARKAQERYGTSLEQPGATLDGWHFLTGEQDAVATLADSVGIRYKALEDKEQQFAHPAAIVFLSGSGTITRYFTTLNPAPGDLRTALVEASNGTVGTVVDQAFLACAQFNPDSNSYSASAFKVMQYGSALMAIVMGAALFLFWRREKEELETAHEEGLDAVVDERT
ncbi:MAG: SCO family protein [Bacteroidetes bacterium QH_6_63_17]|nr:MAG: SCO family protein [Bacteroidetes bacterium QH_6_63_17]